MINGLILAFQFLTRIPINKNIDFNKKNLSYAISFFPLAGLTLGVVYSILYKIFYRAGNEIAALVVLLGMVFLTGGLHLDGLSDMADGFFSGKDKHKTLEIMKDSRVGAFGVIGIVLILLTKFVLITETNNWAHIVWAAGNARLATFVLICFGKAPNETGSAKLLQDSCSRLASAVSVVIYISLQCYFGFENLLPLLISFLTALYLLYISNRKIGGVNGDINGACIELSEAISLLVYKGVGLWI